MAISLTRGPESSTADPLLLPCGEEQAEPFERAVRPRMPVMRDAEARIAQAAGELVDREARNAIGLKHLRLRRPIFADLQVGPTDLVKLADDLVDQVKPPRRQ